MRNRGQQQRHVSPAGQTCLPTGEGAALRLRVAEPVHVPHCVRVPVCFSVPIQPAPDHPASRLPPNRRQPLSTAVTAPARGLQCWRASAPELPRARGSLRSHRQHVRVGGLALVHVGGHGRLRGAAGNHTGEAGSCQLVG